MKKTLYQITEEAQIISFQLEETGELTAELEQALTISQNELQNKAIDYAYAIKALEDDVVAITEESKRLAARKQSKTNTIERLKEAVSTAMQIYRVDKINSSTLTLSLRKSESVEIQDEKMIPEEYMLSRVVINPDKIGIKKLIQSGEDVPGCSIKTNFNLQIK